MSEEYRVQLDVFTGPLDLLLYLIRRDELDIQDVCLARLTEQYTAYVKVLEVIDPNVVGEFLVMASTLIELKSRALLPNPPAEADDGPDEQRTSLVRQLLEYKRFKDAARSLAEAADERARRFARRPAQLPPELQGVELEDVQIWDLLEAFGKVLNSIGAGPKLHEVRYDDTPIEAHIDSILIHLRRKPATAFTELFHTSRERSQVVGLFLALLELIRRQSLRAEQAGPGGEIYLFLVEESPADPPRLTLVRPDSTGEEAGEAGSHQTVPTKADTPRAAESESQVSAVSSDSIS